MNVHIIGTVVSHPLNTTSESWTHFHLLHLYVHNFTERMTVTCFRQMYATPSGLLTIHSWFQTTTWSQSNGAHTNWPNSSPTTFSRGEVPFQRQGCPRSTGTSSNYSTWRRLDYIVPSGRHRWELVLMLRPRRFPLPLGKSIPIWR